MGADRRDHYSCIVFQRKPALGWVYISGSIHDQVVGKIDASFADLGDQTAKNIALPIHVYSVQGDTNRSVPAPSETDTALRLPDKPSIAVLPFQTMAGDPDRNYLADGVVEAITAALSRIRSFFVIARISASIDLPGKALSVDPDYPLAQSLAGW